MKKRRTSSKTQVAYLEEALRLNGSSIKEGPKRKKWSIHDLATVKPLTHSQSDMFRAWFEDNNICATGSAGTGKTFISIYLALNEVLTGRQNRIIIIRSAVPTLNIGFLPGTLEEKLTQYEAPYHNMLHELIGRKSTYTDMKDAGIIEFHSTSFLRGLTWDDTVVVVDESENLTFHEINTIMTRLGNNSRIIFAGDRAQTDLRGSRNSGTEGLSYAKKVFSNMKYFETIEFNVDDIVRGPLVKSWLVACEDTNPI